jgi:hypothetical protein
VIGTALATPVAGASIAVDGLPVALRHQAAGWAEPYAVVAALTGADEVALATLDASSPGWVTAALAAATRQPGGTPVSADALRALTVGDRNALLLAVVAVTYGPRLSWVVGCSSCGEPLDAELDARALLAGEPAQPEPTDGWRLPTGADIEAVAGLGDAATARAALLERCVDALPDRDAAEVAVIEAAMAAADPLADVELAVSCVRCDATMGAALDPALELAERLARWPELVVDTHALALAYGWPEPAVLALPRPRRRQYLALLADGDG